MKGKTVIVLVAHGTVEDLNDLPAFVTEIRRGRPPSAELLSELRRRYEAIGGSPLLRDTRLLADRLSEFLGLEVRVAMRLWKPRLAEVASDLSSEDTVVLVPLAPFSVEVYRNAAARELASLDNPPKLISVEAYGSHPKLLEAWGKTIEAAGESSVAIVTAHSLPMQVIRGGDRYAVEFEDAVRALEKEVGRPLRVAYQSQGAVEGEWLGPSLNDILGGETFAGSSVTVAPIGFLSEHVETLYDLDVEARGIASARGIEFRRANTVFSEASLIEALGDIVAQAIARDARAV